MSSSGRGARAVRVGCIALGAVLFLYWPFVLSRGDLITGDMADNRLLIVILEHWRAVCVGRASMANPNFFAPFPDALGLSESMFLFAPFHVMFRAIGCDRYLAFQFTLMMFRLMGFVFQYRLLRCFRLSMLPALFGAALFTCANVNTVSGLHAQLASIALLPMIAWLLFVYWERRSRIALGAAAVLLGLLFFTCYYIAFFAVLAGCVGVVARVVLTRRAAFRISLFDAALALVLFGVSLGPFLYVYLPALDRTGGRSFGETLVYMLDWRAALDVGPHNLAWGRVAGKFYGSWQTGTAEYGRGWPPLTALTAAMAAGIALWPGKKRRPVPALIGVTCLLLYLLSVKFGQHTLWWLVFHAGPGAQGIRVPGRINHVISLGVAVLCAYAIQMLIAQRRLVFATLLAAAILVEQVNLDPWAEISRASEKQIFARFAQPPDYCKTFFAVNARQPDATGQIDAMLLARRWDIPTINGRSGEFPPGWYLVRFDSDYFSEARNYALQLGLTNGLCSADSGSGEWAAVDARTGRDYALGSEIHFGVGGNAATYKGLGWSYAEGEATWTVGRDATLFLGVKPVPGSDVMLSAEMAAFTPGLNVSVLVNGARVADWSAGQGVFVRTAKVPAGSFHAGPARLDFLIDHPRSPAELGLSPDMRKLGIAVRKMRLIPL